MYPLTAVKSVIHKISLCSSACVFSRAYLNAQIKCISPASNNYASALLLTHVLQAPRFDGVLIQKHTKYILPPVSIACYCSCTTSLPKHVLQAHIFNGAFLQRHTICIPPASINSTSASYCSCTPSSPKLVVLAPSVPFTCRASTESCSRLLAALPSCLESTRLLHHSNLSCTRASTPLMKSSKSLIDRSLVPELLEKDLIETSIKGWGPGGQAVNKSNNAVYLKHVPTGLFVKVHMHRMRHKNALEARALLLDKLDVLVNGPNSVSAQKARLLEKRFLKSESKARKLRDLKAQRKQALVGEDSGGSEDKDQGDDLRDKSGSGNGSTDGRGSGNGSRDRSGSGNCSRYKRAGSLEVHCGDGNVNSGVGNWEQEMDANKKV